MLPNSPTLQSLLRPCRRPRLLRCLLHRHLHVNLQANLRHHRRQRRRHHLGTPQIAYLRRRSRACMPQSKVLGLKHCVGQARGGASWQPMSRTPSLRAAIEVCDFLPAPLPSLASIPVILHADHCFATLVQLSALFDCLLADRHWPKNSVGWGSRYFGLNS